MNIESWDPLYIFFAIVTIPLCMMAIGLKFYDVYSERKEREHIKLAKQLIWETL
jgi:hypothetical protein